MQMQLPVSFSISRKKASLAQAEIAPQPRESGGGLMARTGSIEHSIQAVVSDARNVHAGDCLLSPFLVPAAVKRISTFIRAVQPNYSLFHSFSLDLTSPTLLFFQPS